MKIKYGRQFFIGLMVFLIIVLVVGAELIFIKQNQQNPITADSITPATLSFTGGGAKTVGDNFNMTAVLSTGGNTVCVIDFTITYPANLLELKSSSLGTPFSMVTTQTVSAGSIHYQVGATGCSAVNTTIFNMSFNAKASGSASIAFPAADLLGGSDGQQVISVTKGSSTVTIAALPVPSPIVSYPSVNRTYKDKFTIFGTKSSLATQIFVNNSNVGVVLNNNAWSKEVTLNIGEKTTFTIVAKDGIGTSSQATTFNVTRYKIGDTNNDGLVKINDFSALMFNWAKQEAGNLADFNEDGNVNLTDFGMMMSSWGG